MPFRMLNDSDQSRTDAYDGMFTKQNNTPVAQRVFTPDQFAEIVAKRAAWKAANDVLAVADFNAQRANETKEAKGVILERFVIHFIRVFYLAIARGEYPATARALYKLEVNDDTVPPITSQAARISWAQNIATGEAARAASEGPSYNPMDKPSAEEVAAALADYENAIAGSRPHKDAFDDAQKAVENLRPGTNQFILEKWDEIEFHHRHEEPDSLRRKCREWGVTYRTRPGEPPEEPENPEPPPPPNP